MMHKLVLVLVAGLAVVAPAASKPRPAPPVIGEEARIPFAYLQGGIRSFHADDADTVYLQDRRGQWYRGEIAGACIGLPWAMHIGVDSRGSGTFDRSGTLLVEGDRCMLSSLTYSERPPRRASRRTRGKPAS